MLRFSLSLGGQTPTGPRSHRSGGRERTACWPAGEDSSKTKKPPRIRAAWTFLVQDGHKIGRLRGEVYGAERNGPTMSEPTISPHAFCKRDVSGPGQASVSPSTQLTPARQKAVPQSIASSAVVTS